MRDCKIISITNSKGGVGKTTTALNLGAALHDKGKRVLLIDSDPQGNLTAAMGYTPAELKYTLTNLYLAAVDYPEDLEIHIGHAVVQTSAGPDLIPANRRLSDASARLQVLQAAQYHTLDGDESVCKKMMERVISTLRGGYDHIIIDCGLKHGILTFNALAASDYCIIPVQSHFLASEGIPDVMDMVRHTKAKYNPRLQVAGILLTMYQSRPQLCRNVRTSVEEIYGDDIHVFERPIEYSIKVAECPAAGQSILTSEPKNPAAISYRSLAEEVLRLG